MLTYAWVLRSHKEEAIAFRSTLLCVAFGQGFPNLTRTHIALASLQY